MRSYILVPLDPDNGKPELERAVDLTEDDIQDICTALVKGGRRVFAEQIAERLAPEEAL